MRPENSHISVGGRMATVKARKRKKGTVYCAEVRLKGHPRFSQTFDRKSEAVRWAEETEIALRNGSYVANELPNGMRFWRSTKAKPLPNSSKNASRSRMMAASRSASE